MTTPLGLVLFALLATSISAGDWTIATVAGTGTAGFSGDGGPAVAAQINDPYGVIRGPDGALWFCEHAGHRIRRIAPDGTISTVAGTGRKGYAGDGGPAGAAAMRGPHSIQFGSDDRLYICDVGNHVIRIVDPATGLIIPFAGTGIAGPTPDGSPIAGTPLNNPRSLDVDRAGNLWLVTREGNQVLKLDPKAGVIRHIAGTGAAGFTGNGGPAQLATLSGPKGIALDAAGNAWLADTESHTVRMVDARTGRLELMAGTGTKGDGPDGDPLRCAMNRLHGIFVDADGSVLIGDSEAHRVRVLRRK